MANFLHDNEDLQFYLRDGVDWETLIGLTECGYRSPGGLKSSAEALELYRDVAAMVGEFVAEEVAPYAARDRSRGGQVRRRRGHLPGAAGRHLPQDG